MVKENEVFDVVEVGFFSFGTKMLEANYLAYSLQQSRRLSHDTFAV